MLNKIAEFIAKIKSRLFEIEVDYINGPDTLPPPLTKSEENSCLEKFEEGDKDAREKLHSATASVITVSSVGRASLRNSSKLYSLVGLNS